MTPLACYQDYVNRAGSISEDDQGRIDFLLTDASGAVRAAANGQIISLIEDDEVALRPYCGRVFLPQVPVVDVTAIEDADGNDVEFIWEQGDTFVIVAGGRINRFDYELVIGVPPPRLTVTYTHGYDPVPDEIIGLVCQIAGRALGTPATSAGVTQESLGAYSYSIGSVAAAGPLGLLDSERVIAGRYRRPVAPVSVLSCL